MATWMGTALASGDDSRETARQAAQQAMDKMGNRDQLKLCIVYANADYDLNEVVGAIRELTGDAPLIGCSSTGEFTDNSAATGAVVVTMIASDKFEVRLGSASQYNQDIRLAVSKATSGFLARTADKGIRAGWRGRTLLLFTDGLAGAGEDLIDELITQTGMQYQLFGGAAADNAEFRSTYVFHDDQVLTDSFVVAEILTAEPFAIAAEHGWRPLDGPYRVTRAEGKHLYELNGRPAWQVYKDFADRHNLTIEEGGEAGFLMRFILGVEVEDSVRPKLRVPLGLTADGVLLCAAEISEGEVVYIMSSEDNSDIVASGRTALDRARRNINSEKVAGALVFECVATRLHLDNRFEELARQTAEAVEPSALMGCACFGQLARTHDEFSGQGCATSLVCLIPA